jgi:murein DD-endopeptidase MepM/ murein hydrolase activator NlpD
MEVQTLLNAPVEETKPTIVAKTTKIKSLIDISVETKKTSKQLRKIFEKGIYQKKTQLSILTKYKKRLDATDKQEESKQKKLSRKKLTPKNAIPNFASKLFTANNDPLASIAQLAAFKAFLNFGEGNIMTGLGQSLLAGGLLLAPAFVQGAGNAMLGRTPKPQKGFDVTGRRVTRPTQQRYLRRYGEGAFKNRFGKDALKTATQGSEVAQTATKGSKVGKAFGRFGAALIPGVGAAVGVADAALRAQSGDTTGSAIAGTAAALDAAAAASAVTGIGLPVAGLLSVASFALDATNLIRDLSGVSSKEEKNKQNQAAKPQQTKIEERLKEETQKQKEQSASRGSTLSFKTTLVGYEKTIKKFEEFVTVFTGQYKDNPYNEQPMPAPTQVTPGAGYDGPISGETFFPLPGGDVGTRGKVSAVQAFGAPRDGGTRPHAGLDMTHHSGSLNAAVSAYKTGKVIAAVNNGYNGYVEIDHGEGLLTRYVHITPSVRVGQTVYGGQQIGNLFPAGQDTHLHFEIYRNGSAADPLPILGSVKNRITSPLDTTRAKQHHDSTAATPAQPSRQPPGAVGPAPGDRSGSGGGRGSGSSPSVRYSTPGGRPSTADQLKSIGVDLSSTQPTQVPVSFSVAKIENKPMKYETAMVAPPVKTLTVPLPLPPQESSPQQIAASPSMPLNNSMDTDAMILKTLMYKSAA